MLTWYESLPIIWLGFVCILDFWFGFGLRVFYCSTLRNIILRHCNLVKDHEKDNCLICTTLMKHSKDFDAYCPKNIGLNNPNDDLWTQFKQMSYRYQQSAFFEVIVIQFFIGFIKSRYVPQQNFIIPTGLPYKISQIIPISQISVGDFYLLTAFIFMFLFYVVFTIILESPNPLFINKYYRFFFLVFIFVFLMRF